jgi:hypothetical protein
MPSRLAIVTGASAGIGRALARELARSGRPVLAVARRADRLQALAAEVAAEGGADLQWLALDLATPGAAERVREAAARLGGAAWLVNNAGFGLYGPFEKSDPLRLVEMIRLNCESVVTLTHALLPLLRASGDGVVLNVASAAAFQPTPWLGAYGATKAFVLSLTEALAEELRGSGVFAAAFCPGPVTTEFGAVAGVGDRFARVPGVLTAEEAAAQALRQVARREVVRVPGAVYKATSFSARLLPRGILRRMSGRVHRPGEGT